MTTITTANPTEIQTAAAEATKALERLLQMAREDYTLDIPLAVLDALAASDGPLSVLSEQLGELDAYLAGFDRDEDTEHDGIDSARDWLDLAITSLDETTGRIDSVANCIRDLV